MVGFSRLPAPPDRMKEPFSNSLCSTKACAGDLYRYRAKQFAVRYTIRVALGWLSTVMECKSL
jgi:hypothetical protein